MNKCIDCGALSSIKSLWAFRKAVDRSRVLTLNILLHVSPKEWSAYEIAELLHSWVNFSNKVLRGTSVSYPFGSIGGQYIRVKNSSHLDEHLSSWSEFCRFQRFTIRTHRLAISREFERKLFLPGRLDVQVAQGPKILLWQSTLLNAVDIHLFDENSQCRFGRLAYFLVGVFRLHSSSINQSLTLYTTTGAVQSHLQQWYEVIKQ